LKTYSLAATLTFEIGRKTLEGENTKSQILDVAKVIPSRTKKGEGDGMTGQIMGR